MSVESRLRREMLKLLREMDVYPYKKEREALLWDTVMFACGLLGVTVDKGREN